MKDLVLSEMVCGGIIQKWSCGTIHLSWWFLNRPWICALELSAKLFRDTVAPNILLIEVNSRPHRGSLFLSYLEKEDLNGLFTLLTRLGLD